MEYDPSRLSLVKMILILHRHKVLAGLTYFFYLFLLNINEYFISDKNTTFFNMQTFFMLIFYFFF